MDRRIAEATGFGFEVGSVDGMVEAARGRTRLVHGYELAYFHNDPRALIEQLHQLPVYVVYAFPQVFEGHRLRLIEHVAGTTERHFSPLRPQ